MIGGNKDSDPIIVNSTTTKLKDSSSDAFPIVPIAAAANESSTVSNSSKPFQNINITTNDLVNATKAFGLNPISGLIKSMDNATAATDSKNETSQVKESGEATESNETSKITEEASNVSKEKSKGADKDMKKVDGKKPTAKASSRTIREKLHSRKSAKLRAKKETESGVLKRGRLCFQTSQTCLIRYKFV